MNFVLFQNTIKNDDIIDVNFNKTTNDTQQKIDFFLYIKRIIFVIYHNYIELFLFVMRHYRKFMSIC